MAHFLTIHFKDGHDLYLNHLFIAAIAFGWFYLLSAYTWKKMWVNALHMAISLLLTIGGIVLCTHIQAPWFWGPLFIVAASLITEYFSHKDNLNFLISDLASILCITLIYWLST